MRYLILFYQDETGASMGEAQARQRRSAQLRRLRSSFPEPQLECTALLYPSYATTTIRAAGTEAELVDGPLSTSPLQLSACCVLNCQNLDSAIHWAETVWRDCGGVIEIWPMM